LRFGERPALASTVREFNECCNFFLKLGYASRTWSKKKLQSLGYYEARAKWPKLQSSLVQGARDCAADMLKREKCERLPSKKLDSAARFNQRTFKAFLDSGQLSITTVEGRIRVPLHIPTYFRRYIHGKGAALRLRVRRGVVFADLVVDLPEIGISVPKEPRVLGVDRGIVNIAVTSDGKFFNSKALRNVQGRYAFAKAGLQSAGTRSARRHLRRLSGRERRFQTDSNHRIAKTLAEMDFDALALEDLSVKKGKRNGRRFNRMLGRWAFVQLQEFATYKFEERGKPVVLVAPQYTSQDCSRCRRRGSRKGSDFQCRKCGLRLNADLNAARNIAQRGTTRLGRLLRKEPENVNQPIVAEDFFGQDITTPAASHPILLGVS
jgi:IS605 OrfB family transposase